MPHHWTLPAPDFSNILKLIQKVEEVYDALDEIATRLQIHEEMEWEETDSQKTLSESGSDLSEEETVLPTQEIDDVPA